MQPTDQQINELRNNFLKKVNDGGGESSKFICHSGTFLI